MTERKLLDKAGFAGGKGSNPECSSSTSVSVLSNGHVKPTLL